MNKPTAAADLIPSTLNNSEIDIRTNGAKVVLAAGPEILDAVLAEVAPAPGAPYMFHATINGQFMAYLSAEEVRCKLTAAVSGWVAA